MPEVVVGRADELAGMAGFLDSVTGGPAALVRRGDPGIGKACLWRAESRGGGRDTEGSERVRGRGLDLERGMPDGCCASLTLGGLTLGAVHRLLHDRLGVALPRTTLLRVHSTSGGNPLWAVELARALGPDARPLPPGSLLPVPADLGRLLGRGLAALPASAREVLLAAAELAAP